MPNSMQLKILSWNIWYDGNFEEIVKFFEVSRADIIGLQEVALNDPTRDIITYLKKFGYNHVFAPALTLEDGRIVGNAIFSKYKITNDTTHILSEERSRVVVGVDIQIGGTTFRVLNLHLVHTHQQPSEIQNTQAENLIRIIPRRKALVMGDFNATPESPIIKKMRSIMIDTEPQSVATLNVDLFDCPDCNPKIIANTRLDYIFTSKDVKTSVLTVEHANGSDHFPLCVIIEI